MQKPLSGLFEAMIRDLIPASRFLLWGLSILGKKFHQQGAKYASLSLTRIGNLFRRYFIKAKFVYETLFITDWWYCRRNSNAVVSRCTSFFEGKQKNRFKAWFRANGILNPSNREKRVEIGVRTWDGIYRFDFRVKDAFFALRITSGVRRSIIDYIGSRFVSTDPLKV